MDSILTSTCIDVTMPIFNGMLLWPGSPETKIELLRSIEKGDTSNVSALNMSVHSGTHVDAPFHSFKDGKGIESIRADILIGKVSVFELDVNDSIKKEDIEGLNFKGVKRVFFKTKNSSYLKEKKFKDGFIYISDSAADFMVKTGIKLVGIDYLSIERHEQKEKPAHHILLSSNVVIIEGLDLSKVTGGEYNLIALPILIKGADGAPARVLLIQIK